MLEVSLPNLRWYANRPRVIGLPERWRVEVLRPPGFAEPGLTADQISEAFRRPIGTARLEELAGRAGAAVVVFDDMTRPTPVGDILPWVMEALGRGGILGRNIRFIPALGLHGAMNNLDFRKKLGPEILENYPIFNHNPYENCTHLGTTRSGTPVQVNREFLNCDLRIGIGCITPHVHVGFGGGGKIVFPGISGIESVHAFHSEVFQRSPETTGLGNFEHNAMYAEIVEAVRMAGLDLLINGILNDRGQLAGLFVGDPLEAHQAGVRRAREHYATAPSGGKDIVIANAYGKASEMAICMVLAMQTVNPDKGVVVLVADVPEGQVCHYLFRSFGKSYGGRMYPEGGEKRFPVASERVKLVVCTRYPDQTMCDVFARPEEVNLTRSWEETLELLEREYPREASVAVIPDGTMQYFRRKTP